MEGLNFDSIMDDEDFIIPEDQQDESSETEDNKITEVVDFESLEDPDNEPEENEKEKPESVGGEDDTRETEDTDQSKGQGSSPITFSSIAKAFAEEGVFPDLEDADIEAAKDAAGFVELVKKQVQSQLDETQKRVLDALDAGMDNDTIRVFESNIKYLSNITEEHLKNEDNEELRQRLIYQDFINKGMSPEQAKKLTIRSVKSGSDIEDAKEALANNIDFYKAAYQKQITDAQNKAKEEKANIEKQAAELKKSILEDKELFGDLEVDKATRNRIYDAVAKPIYKDPETGDKLTAIQKYEMEHPNEFLKYVSLMFVLTDQFTKPGNLLKGQVKKEVGKGMKALEKALSTSSRSSNAGNLDFLGGLKDPESSIHKLKLDI